MYSMSRHTKVSTVDFFFIKFNGTSSAGTKGRKTVVVVCCVTSMDTTSVVVSQQLINIQNKVLNNCANSFGIS